MASEYPSSTSATSISWTPTIPYPDSKSTYENQDSGINCYSSIITNNQVSPNETSNQQYLLLPLKLRTDTTTYSINDDSAKVGH